MNRGDEDEQMPPMVDGIAIRNRVQKAMGRSPPVYYAGRKTGTWPHRPGVLHRD